MIEYESTKKGRKIKFFNDTESFNFNIIFVFLKLVIIIFGYTV